MKKLSIVLLILLSLTISVGCFGKKDKLYETNGFGMGTVISQKIYGKDAAYAAVEVFDKIKYLEGLMTINSPGGDINNLNKNAQVNFVELNAETFICLNKSLEFSKLSNGAYDVTCGSVVKCWNIGTENARIPEPNELLRLKPLVNYECIHLDYSNKKAFLEKIGQIVDLGSIAKGYAGDECIKIYKKYGFLSACLNLGGNVVTLGSREDGKPWNIGIQNPRATNGNYIGIVKVTNKSVVTSGDYERYFEKDGKRYHHIFDPSTCKPAESGLMSVTIVTDSSIDADGLSTSAFVLGLEKGMQLIKKYGKAEAIFITTDKKVHVTEKLKGEFTFKDESGEFKYESEELKYAEKR